MSEREDVEDLDEVFDRLSVPSWIRPPLMEAIAAHVEAVRVSERVRLAGEVEAALSSSRMQPYADGTGGWLFRHATVKEQAAAVIAALDRTPGVRLTEERMNEQANGGVDCTCGAPTLKEHRHFEGCPACVCIDPTPHDAHGDCGGVPHPSLNQQAGGLNLARLREVAERATPGPWAQGMAGNKLLPEVDNRFHFGMAVLTEVGTDDGDGGVSTAAFIATFDPPTVLALLDALVGQDAGGRS